MNQGGDAIRERGKEAKVFTENQIAQADSFDKAWNNASNTFQATWIGFANDLMPVVTSALKELTDYLNDKGVRENIAAMGKVFANTFQIIWFFAKRIIEVVNAIGAVVDWVSKGSGWIGEKIGGALFDQTGQGGQTVEQKAANILGKSGVKPNATLPSSVASGDVVNNTSSVNKTTNNNPVQNNVINVYGATNSQQMVEQMNQAVGTWSDHMNTLAIQ